jgi:hypothetical protein
MSDHQLSSSVKRSVLNIIDDLWEMFASDMHAAAYLLNPRYYHLIHDLVGDKELMHGLRRIIIKLTTSAEADILTRYRSSPKHTRLMHLNSCRRSPRCLTKKNGCTAVVSPEVWHTDCPAPPHTKQNFRHLKSAYN